MNLILHRILSTNDLDAWAKLKKEFFEPPYTEVYSLIEKFYTSHEKLPSFDELELVTRDERQRNYVTALREVNVPETLDNQIILEALINDYSQREVLNKLSGYLDSLVYKDVEEIVEHLSDIAVHIEEQTEVSEYITSFNTFKTYDEQLIESRIYLGLNNDFDRETLGAAPGEFILLGGYRGSGKSVVCANLTTQQHRQSNASLFFSIEMSAREIYNRKLSILSGVPEKHIKSGKLTFEEQVAIATVKARMTKENSSDLLEEFHNTQDFDRFESAIIQRPVASNKEMIIVDNPKLTIQSIDAILHKYKNKLGDELKLVVVDYINQIESRDPYDWKVQIEHSKRLKALAKKYEVVMVSPFQITEDGAVRFSKGILDSADWAFNLKPVKEESVNGIEFECKKARGDEMISFASAIDWPTLTIHPARNLEFMKKEAPKKKKTEDDLSL